MEEIIHPLLRPRGEPLHRMAEFAVMRMFYVALSRAKNLLVIAHYSGRGQHTNEPFSFILDESFPRIRQFDVRSLPEPRRSDDELPKTYSYTGDFLLYKRCPRQYMAFRKYGFVPSRSQTMFEAAKEHGLRTGWYEAVFLSIHGFPQIRLRTIPFSDHVLWQPRPPND